MSAADRLQVEALFDPATSTLSYLVHDRASRAAALIDSVLDFDPKSGRTATTTADRLIARVRELDLKLEWILETHVHADHLSAAPYLRRQLGGRIGIGAQITTVQQVFGKVFNAGAVQDPQPFDHLFTDGETFSLGGLSVRALHTPGHTPACMSYLFEAGDTRAVFVGDTLFMPDYGTARCDFPGGDARTLYRSVNKLLSLPADTLIYTGHDYQPGGRPLAYRFTVAEAREHNIHVRDGISEDAFVALREARDATLAMPVLMLPAVQVNMRAGQLPEAESNGTRYLKIPIDAL